MSAFSSLLAAAASEPPWDWVIMILVPVLLLITAFLLSNWFTRWVGPVRRLGAAAKPWRHWSGPEGVRIWGRQYLAEYSYVRDLSEARRIGQKLGFFVRILAQNWDVCFKPAGLCRLWWTSEGIGIDDRWTPFAFTRKRLIPWHFIDRPVKEVEYSFFTRPGPPLGGVSVKMLALPIRGTGLVLVVRPEVWKEYVEPYLGPSGRALVAPTEQVNAPDERGRMPIHEAAQQGRIEAVEYLVSDGADITVADEDGITPLHCAAMSAGGEIVDFLVRHGADANTGTKTGSTPLHVAAERNNMNAASALLSHGSDVDKQDKEERTPLHVAASCGHDNVVWLLMGNGADVGVRDKSGRTAEQCAEERNHSKVVELFKQHGAKK